MSAGTPLSETESSSLVASLALRERYRDEYWRRHDPIADDRLLWRAQTFRHTVHLLPGQTILELGCGELRLTRALLQISRSENPITAVTFQSPTCTTANLDGNVELIHLHELPDALGERRFDCIVAMDLLDRRTSDALLNFIYDLLVPGGEMVFYESNPWNPVYKVNALVSRAFGKPDPRNLIDRPRLYEQLSDIGFIRIYAVFNDFVFALLTRPVIWLLRNLSILLENAPLVQRMAGSILLHAQKPPREKVRAHVSLFTHAGLRGAVSVVIPCRNEQPTVRRFTETILELYGEYVHEIIPVDDASTDGTWQIISELAAADSRIKPIHRTGPTHGVGLALAEGMAASTGRYVLTIDCDFEHLLPEFRDLFDGVAEGFDVVIGSRFSRHSVLLNYPFLKIFANRAFHAVAVVLFGRRIRDVTNNLKIMRRDVVRDLRLRQQGFAANAETGLQPIVLGYSIKQVPISWINRNSGMGASSFRLGSVAGGYWQVSLGLWLYHLFAIGPYRGLARRAAAGGDIAPAASASSR